jgi:hypothetical protein
MPDKQFVSNEPQRQEETDAEPKRAYQTPELEDYGSVSIRTRNLYGYGVDAGPPGYNFGTTPPYSV